MKLGSIRQLDGMKPVLKDPESNGPDPVYWVFPEISDTGWANMTVIAPGRFDGEYPKTFGHYHPEDAPDETYHLIEGEGILQLQKKQVVNGVWDSSRVEEVYLIKAKPGDEIVISKEFGHSWSNIGHEPLLSFDDWRLGHTPTDYEPIERLHGMAYYLVEEDGEVKAKGNPNYANLPQPKWLATSEFKALANKHNL